MKNSSLFSPFCYALMLILLCASLPCWAQVKKSNVTANTPINTIQQANIWYLSGNFTSMKATVQTGNQNRTSTFRGSIAMRVQQTSKQVFSIYLEQLNLVGKSIQTANGQSGGISLQVDKRKKVQSKVGYETNKKRLNAKNIQMYLHYALIDEIRGFVPNQEREPDYLIPFFEGGNATFSGNLDRALRQGDQRRYRFNGKLKFNLDDPELGYITIITIEFTNLFLEPSLWVYTDLCIQPVFIRSGVSDPSPAGEHFETLMDNAQEIWGKCCVTFTVRTPIYINESDYKTINASEYEASTLSTPAEADEILREIDPDGTNDCIEIFVASDWNRRWDGGGFTRSSGTASARILTVDQQLEIPCSGPGDLDCRDCGALNQNHLAHELGHVFGFCHPDSRRCNPPMIRATNRTVLDPSGWCADNPDRQSVFNCLNASNPLVRIVTRRTRCDGGWEIE